MTMRLKLITDTTGQPIDLDEAKDQLYVTDNDRDAEINRKVKAATKFCEQRISGARQFMAATYDGILEEWPAGSRVEFPVPPLQSITNLKYYDSDGTLQTISSTASSTVWTLVNPTDGPGFADPAYGTVWPTARARPDAITWRFVAGYSSAATVPDNIKEAIQLTLGHLWVNRQAVVTGTIASEVQMGVDALLGGSDYGSY